MYERGRARATREVLDGGGGSLQQVAGDGEAWPWRMAEGPVVPWKPGNAGGGKGPWFRINAGSGEGKEGILVRTTSMGKSAGWLPTKAVTTKTVTTKPATTKPATGKAATPKAGKAAKSVAAVPSLRILKAGRCPTVSGKSTLKYHRHRGGRQRVAGRGRQRRWRHHHGRWDEVLRLSCLGGGSMSRQGRVILDDDERAALHTIAFPAKRGRIGRWYNLG